ncbi:MAG TPA: nitroreductase/quinone reductase family protein [Acidimicrobiales bacterium]|nr:nitroreductase/quinone reductase family protein [Acidimicrobiales bacterium]
MAKAVEAAQVRRFGRSAVSVVFRTPVLVLETIGRRSRAKRSTTLAFKRLDDGTLLVVGGAGGQARVPDWVANLRANPQAVAWVDRAPLPVLAVEMTGADRQEAWRHLCEVWPRIDRYERRAGRRVPVFRLRRE